MVNASLLGAQPESQAVRDEFGAWLQEHDFKMTAIRRAMQQYLLFRMRRPSNGEGASDAGLERLLRVASSDRYPTLLHLQERKDEVTSYIVRWALARTKGNQSAAARLLDISGGRLDYLIGKHGIVVADFSASVPRVETRLTKSDEELVVAAFAALSVDADVTLHRRLQVLEKALIEGALARNPDRSLMERLRQAADQLGVDRTTLYRKKKVFGIDWNNGPQVNRAITAILDQPNFALKPWLRKAETWGIRGVLEQAGGNVSEAARLLGMPGSTLSNRMNQLGIQVVDASARDEASSAVSLDREIDAWLEEHGCQLEKILGHAERHLLLEAVQRAEGVMWRVDRILCIAPSHRHTLMRRWGARDGRQSRFYIRGGPASSPLSGRDQAATRQVGVMREAVEACAKALGFERQDARVIAGGIADLTAALWRPAERLSQRYPVHVSLRPLFLEHPPSMIIRWSTGVASLNRWELASLRTLVQRYGGQLMVETPLQRRRFDRARERWVMQERRPRLRRAGDRRGIAGKHGHARGAELDLSAIDIVAYASARRSRKARQGHRLDGSDKPSSVTLVLPVPRAQATAQPAVSSSVESLGGGGESAADVMEGGGKAYVTPRNPAEALYGFREQPRTTTGVPWELTPSSGRDGGRVTYSAWNPASRRSVTRHPSAQTPTPSVTPSNGTTSVSVRSVSRVAEVQATTLEVGATDGSTGAGHVEAGSLRPVETVALVVSARELFAAVEQGVGSSVEPLLKGLASNRPEGFAHQVYVLTEGASAPQIAALHAIAEQHAAVVPVSAAGVGALMKQGWGFVFYGSDPASFGGSYAGWLEQHPQCQVGRDQPLTALFTVDGQALYLQTFIRQFEDVERLKALLAAAQAV